MEPVGVFGPIERGYAPRYVGHITSSSGAVRAAVPDLANAVQPASAPRIEHKVTHRFGMRREEAAPAAVVAPATGRRALPRPEAQPPFHVCFGHPHPLFPVRLPEHHDVGHASVVAHPLILRRQST